MLVGSRGGTRESLLRHPPWRENRSNRSHPNGTDEQVPNRSHPNGTDEYHAVSREPALAGSASAVTEASWLRSWARLERGTCCGSRISARSGRTRVCAGSSGRKQRVIRRSSALSRLGCRRFGVPGASLVLADGHGAGRWVAASRPLHGWSLASLRGVDKTAVDLAITAHMAPVAVEQLVGLGLV